MKISKSLLILLLTFSIHHVFAKEKDQETIEHAHAKAAFWGGEDVNLSKELAEQRKIDRKSNATRSTKLKSTKESDSKLRLGDIKKALKIKQQKNKKQLDKRRISVGK